jgi:uncharacterized protein YdeI (YjbR/CyaY-like superfamily)
MSKGKSGPRYEAFLRAAEPWQDELEQLRRIVLECGLTEEVKWGAPCFTADGGNVVILGVLNDLCCLSFFKGVLLTDPEGILLAPGENSRSGRLIPFTEVAQILEMEPVLKAYVREAAELERAGAKVDFAKDREDLSVPAELQARFDEDPAFRAAFEALTPGRRRGWILHFSGAKQSATRASRIAKAAPRILDGKGMHDR